MRIIVNIGTENLAKKQAEDYVASVVEIFQKSHFFIPGDKVVYIPQKNEVQIRVETLPAWSS